MPHARSTDLNNISNPELRAPLLELKQQRDRARLHPAKPAPKKMEPTLARTLYLVVQQTSFQNGSTSCGVVE
jgi:hypothetical protein